MSTTEEHVERAESLLRESHRFTGGEGNIIVARAQVQATLAQTAVLAEIRDLLAPRTSTEESDHA